jgi:actin related protein 2/3 complex subunit 1A/1B
VIAGGHDCSPLVFTTTGDGSWAFSNLISEKKDPVAQKTGGTKQAFELFKNKVEVGANTNVQTLSTLHQNCVTCVRPFEGTGKDVKKFTTSALDGKLVVWNSA